MEVFGTLDTTTEDLAKMASKIKPAGEEPQITGTVASTDKQIIESLKIPFKPVDNKVLVKPLPVEKIKKVLTVLDEPKNKNLKPGDTMFTKDITKNVETDFRKGVILDMGSRASEVLLKDADIKVGDTIVFHKNLAEHAKFDLYRDSLLINTYDVVCKHVV